MSETLSSYPFDTVSTFRRRVNRKGQHVTLMVCGRSGLGKSTFLNTLCDGSIYEDEEYENRELPKTLEIVERSVLFKDSEGRPINITVVDTPGFGVELNNQNQVDKVKGYVEEKFDDVLKEESRVDRSKFLPDSRVHCLLYFIPNSGHDLDELDLKAIKKLSEIVNVLPVIAKCDTLTRTEMIYQKELIRTTLEREQIKLFDFGDDSTEKDSEEYQEILALRQMLPLAVSGSNILYKIGDNYVRGREYLWGFARSDDDSFSDLSTVREMLFSDHLLDLKEATLGLYENYRTKVLIRNAQAAKMNAEKGMGALGSSSIGSISSMSGLNLNLGGNAWGPATEYGIGIPSLNI